MHRIFLTTILTLLGSLLFAQPLDDILKHVSVHLSNGNLDSAKFEIGSMDKVTDELTTQHFILANLQVAAYYTQNRLVEECTATIEAVDGLIEKFSISNDSINYQLNLIRGANFIRQYKAEEAISALKKSTSLYHSKGYIDSVELASLYGNIANAHYINFQYDSSSKYYQNLIPLLQSEKVEKELGVQSYWSIALYYNSKGLVDSSLIYSQKVLDILGGPNSENARIHVAMNTNRSIDLRKMYRVEEALESVSANTKLVDSFGLKEDDQMVIDAKYELAQVYQELDRNREAIQMFRRIRETETSIYGENHINNAYNYVGAANAYQNMAQFDSALIFYDQAIRITNLQESDFSYYKSSIDQLKGDVFLKMGLPLKALLAYHLAFEGSGFEKDPNAFGQAEIALSLAQAHFYLSNVDSAKYYLSRSLKTNINQGNFNELSIPNPDSRVYSVSLVLESLLLYVQLDLLDQGENLTSLCTSFLQWRDQFDLSIKNSNDLTQLVNVQEDLIDVLLKSEVEGDFLVPILFKLHESNQNKLLVNELEFKNIKRSLLSSSTRLSLSSIDQSIEHEKAQLLEGAKEDSETTQSKLDSYLEDREKLLQQLKSSNPSYYQLRYGSIENIVKEVRSLCGENQVAIKFIYTEKSLAALLIEADKSTLFRLDHSAIDSLSKALKQLVSHPDTENQSVQEFSTTSHTLFQKLFGPFYSEIANRDFIVFPDGLLSLIPFEALVVSPQEQATSYKGLDYLIKNNGVNYLHSVQATVLLEQHIVDGAEEIALFNPIYENSEKLSWTEGELNTIQDALQVEVFKAQQASVENFVQRSSEFRYIHFAGHGVLNDDLPLSSHLKFTKSDLSNGELTCADIYKLELPNDMVVLSACETGIGTFHHGEGMISLARAFFYAGAKSVVMSLWKANDRSTSLLMGNFYDELSSGSRKHIALQKAKISYLQETSELTAHPFYWAAFVVKGQTSPINSNRSYWLLFLLPVLLIFFHPQLRGRLFSRS